MTAAPSLSSSFAAVVVAAGEGLRAGQEVPKQFAIWRGKPVLRQAVDALVAAGVHRLVIAIPAGAEQIAAQTLGGIAGVDLIEGGATRQESVARALEALAGDPPEIVLIHDAARPDCPSDVVARLLEALQQNAAAIPVLPVVDSMVHAEQGMMVNAARREDLRRVQTPQAFRFKHILVAHRVWNGVPDAGDDAQVLRAAGMEVALVDGDERLCKLTYMQDFAPERGERPPHAPLPMRVGTGFDVHRLEHGCELWLCGVRIAHDKGLAGHSDADVGLHAIVDAILGAIGRGDIGDHFPPSDPQWKGARSARFLEYAVELAREAGYMVGNVDLTLICEAPRIGPHRAAMRARLAELLQAPIDVVSVKATTTERLGFTGRGEGIAAQAIAGLVPLQPQGGE